MHDALFAFDAGTTRLAIPDEDNALLVRYASGGVTPGDAYGWYLAPDGYDDLPFARWSAVDYTHQEIRELAYRILEEACENYEVDGIELDFNREPYVFRSVALGGAATPAAGAKHRSVGPGATACTRVAGQRARAGPLP